MCINLPNFSIIIIDEFDNLFKVSEKDAFDLFALSKISTIIGISNDIEFL
jgi:Cdc6-like AAA superfamily ATPase